MTDQPRAERGRYVPAEGTAARDAQAFAMRADGRTLREIAIALGYTDDSHAWKSIQRHISVVVHPNAREYVALMDAQIDRLQRAVMGVLEATHYKVSDGRVVYHLSDDCDCTEDVRATKSCPHFTPLIDDSPVLSSVDRLIKLQESRRKLYGLDQPVKHEVAMSDVTVRVVGADDV